MLERRNNEGMSSDVRAAPKSHQLINACFLSAVSRRRHLKSNPLHVLLVVFTLHEAVFLLLIVHGFYIHYNLQLFVLLIMDLQYIILRAKFRFKASYTSYKTCLLLL